MNKIITMYLMVFILLLGNSCSTSVSKDKTDNYLVNDGLVAKNVNPLKFKELIVEKPDAVILDVRTTREVAQGKLTGSINIDINDPEFIEKVSDLDKSKPVLIYCRSGRRSGIAMMKMQNLGFKELYNLNTGILGWNKEGFKVE